MQGHQYSVLLGVVVPNLLYLKDSVHFFGISKIALKPAVMLEKQCLSGFALSILHVCLNGSPMDFLKVGVHDQSQKNGIVCDFRDIGI